MTWSFKKHGAGVKFTNTDDGRLVDICECIDQPELFDKWRLSHYLESINNSNCNLADELTGLCMSGQVLISKDHPKLLFLAR